MCAIRFPDVRSRRRLTTMSRGNTNTRHALIALGMALLAIVLCAWFSQPEFSQASINGSTGYAEAKQGQSSDGSRTVAAMELFNPWQDSYAQWIVAWVSIAGTAISGIAVLLVFKSLTLNREAVDAAVAANVQSRELFLAESRPWLIFKEAAFETYEDGDDGRETTLLVIDVENIGDGHALFVECHSETKIGFHLALNNHGPAKFSERCGNYTSYGNYAVFARALGKVYPVNPGIETGDQLATICVTYRHAGDNSIIYKTACHIRIWDDKAVIEQGSLHVT